MQENFNESGLERRFPIAFQFPPPPLPPPLPPPPRFEFPDLARRTSEERDQEARQGPERETSMKKACRHDRDALDRNRTGVSNRCELAVRLMAAHPSPSDPLITDLSQSRRIEAIDLAINDSSSFVLRVNKQMQRLQEQHDRKHFDHNSDSALTNRIEGLANEASYSSLVATGNGVFRGQLSSPPPPLMKLDQRLCFQGHWCNAPIRFKYPCFVKTGKSLQSKGVQCLFGEYPRSITGRDLRRSKVVTRMPIIKEIERVSSGEEELKSDTGKVPSDQFFDVNKSDMETQSTHQNTSRTELLLDRMHKKYCPDQYNKPQSEKSFQKTNLSSQLKDGKTLKSPQLTLNTFANNIIRDANNYSQFNLSPSATGPSSSPTATGPSCSPIATGPSCSPIATGPSCSPIATGPSCSPIATGTSSYPTATGTSSSKINKSAGRNLAPLLLPCVHLPSSPCTPVSASSVHSLGSPLLSSGSWFDDDPFSPEGTNTGQTTPEGYFTSSQQKSFHPFHEDNNSNTTKIDEEDSTPIAATDSEVEAVEASEWLRGAGFPQYAQMYKDNQFPIDLKSAEKDHEFLDEDALQTFIRRLDVLNKCSSSKLKRSPPNKNLQIYESDEEEDCALSSNWTFQRNSHLWSRNEANHIPHLINQPDPSINGGLHSTSSRDSVFDDSLEKPLSVSVPSSVLLLCEEANRTAATQVCPNAHTNPAILSQGLSSSDTAAEISKTTKLKRPNLFLSPFSSDTDNQAEFLSKEKYKNKGVVHGTNHQDYPIQSRHSSDSENTAHSPCSTNLDPQSMASEKFWRALGKFRRIEGFKMRKSSRKSSKSELTKKDIGSPVLLESPEILMKIDSLQCTDISPATETAKALCQSAIVGQNPDDQKTPPFEDALVLQTSSPRSPNILQLTGKHLPRESDTRGRKDSSRDKSSNYNRQAFNYSLTPPSASEANGRSRSIDGGSKDLEDAVEIISELLHNVNLEVPASVNSRKRISIYDNVSSEVCSVLQNELDDLLSELYKNIDSLNYSMSKVAADQRVESPISSVGTYEEEDVTKTSETSASVTLKNHLAAKDSLVGCESTDGNSSATPSEGSYHLESAAAKHESTIRKFLHDASTVENLPEPSEDGKCVQLCVEAASDPVSDDSVEQTVDDWSYPSRGCARERRDSGVGSSLSRTASSSKRQKRARLRWHSFSKSHPTTLNSYDQPISNLSAGQLVVLRKLSLLKVTAALEKYSPVNRTNWSWFVPRLRRRSKMPDYSERTIFGIPVAVTEQRCGQPLPQCVLYAMRRLRRSADDSVGIFRKPGVRMRVEALKISLESDPDAIDFDGLHAYDVADLLKLYFREFPECLLTNKISDVFISIFLYIPVDLRCDLIPLTLILLPDEHRLVLQSLLLFLNDIAQHSQLNQMNASNLAVCFAPSLFHLCGGKSSSTSSPKQLPKRAPVPSEKDLVEQKVAHECLTYLIINAKSIFTVSEEMLSMCHLSYMEQGSSVPLEDLCRKYGKSDGGNYTTYVDSCIQGVLKESREKFKGWISYLSARGDVDLAYKKVGDGHPLRLWKFCIEVEAPPEELLNRVMRERHLWDDDILKWRTVEKLDSQTEVFQYVLNSMVPHPTRDFSELRSWRTNLSRGMCILISTSVEHAGAPLMGDVRGVVLASRYLIEPCGSGKSRLTHIIRIDLRGHNPDWYNNVYGHICANYARRIRDSFKTSIDLTTGPETKV